MAAITGGAIAVYALITAAVAATAATAIRAATTGFEGGANEAFGSWMQSFFISFATSAAGGAAGAAAGGATTTAATTAETAAGIGLAGAGSGAAVAGGSAAGLAAGGAGGVGVAMSSEALIPEAAAQIYGPESLDPSVMMETYTGGGAEEMLGVGVEQTPWDKFSSELSQFAAGVKKFSPTKMALKELGGFSPEQIAEIDKYGEGVDYLSNLAGQGDKTDAIQKQQQDMFTGRLEAMYGTGGLRQMAKAGKRTGMEEELRREYERLSYIEPYGAFLGEQEMDPYDFGEDLNYG